MAPDRSLPVASIDGRGHLRSASRGQLQVARIKMATYGSLAFGHAGPSTWNTLPNTLKCSSYCSPTFRPHLKHFTSRITSTSSAFEVATVNAVYKLLTYLLTLAHPAFALQMELVLRYRCTWLAVDMDIHGYIHGYYAGAPAN